MNAYILGMQAKMVKALNIKSRPGALEPIEVLSAAIGLSVESSEVLNELNHYTRPWKQGNVPPLEDDKRLDSIIEESIDVLFYLSEIFYLLGYTQGMIEKAYKNKYVKNLARVLNKIDRNKREDAVRDAKNGTFDESTQEGFIMRLLVDLGLKLDEDTELRLMFEPLIVLNQFANDTYK